MDALIFLRDFLELEAQNVGDRALMDRSESVGFQSEIENCKLGNLAKDELERGPHPEIWRIIPAGQFRELSAACLARYFDTM
jgi:hypothetical protein